MSIGIAGGGVSRLQRRTTGLDWALDQGWRRQSPQLGGGSGALLRVGKRENLLCPSSRPLHSSDEFLTIHFFKLVSRPNMGLELTTSRSRVE